MGTVGAGKGQGSASPPRAPRLSPAVGLPPCDLPAPSAGPTSVVETVPGRAPVHWVTITHGTPRPSGTERRLGVTTARSVPSPGEPSAGHETRTWSGYSRLCRLPRPLAKVEVPRWPLPEATSGHRPSVSQERDLTYRGLSCPLGSGQ